MADTQLATPSIDEKIKYISVRTQWGTNTTLPNCIASLDDKQFIIVTGSRICLYDEDSGPSGTRSLFPAVDNTLAVIAIEVSVDKKYLAACLKRGNHAKATIAVYDIESLRSYPKLPRLLLFEEGSSLVSEFYFSYCRFSSDPESRYLAAFGSRTAVGIVIYDWRLERIVQTIHTKSVVSEISFNPTNPTRICATGVCGLFQFWHFTPKSIYNAPISGFTRPDISYTCHAWIGNDCILAGTDRGSVTVVVGCEVKDSMHILGAAKEHTMVQSSIAKLIVHQKMFIGYTIDGFVSIGEIERKEVAAGRSENISITILTYFLPKDCGKIHGIDWYRRGPALPLQVVIVSTKMIATYDVDCKEKLIFSQPDVARKSSNTSDHHIHKMHEQTAIQKLAALWPVLPPHRILSKFHSAGIHSLALSGRGSFFVTASAKDESFRVWDFNKVSDTEIFVDDLSQRRSELPSSIDFHPSGLFVVFGCDEDIKEYAIADSRIELLRRIPARVAINGPNGEPVMNTAPVSIVKYSHGGHLLAVVTGRFCQIYQLYNLNFDTEKAGLPERTMIMTDHVAYITDIAFSRDDDKIYTCAADGAAYEWNISRQTTGRCHDYLMKGMPAIRIAVSPSTSFIAASFEMDYTPTNKRLTLMRSTSNAPSRQNSNQLDDFVSSFSTVHRRTGFAQANNTNNNNSPSTSGVISRTMSNTSDPANPGTKNLAPSKSVLVVWRKHINNSGELDVIALEVPVTALAFGQTDGRGNTELCILGMTDGTVMISLLPIPLKVFIPHLKPETNNLRFMPIASASEDKFALKRNIPSRIASVDVDEADVFDDFIPASTPLPKAVETPPLLAVDKEKEKEKEEKINYTFDETKCRVFQLHDGTVSRLCISLSGLWIFSAGHDGCVFMLSTNLKAKELVDAPEASSGENQVILTDRTHLKVQLSRIEDKDSMLEEMAKDKKNTVARLEDIRIKQKTEMEAVMQREISKRDDIILQGRQEYAQMVKKFQNEIEELHKSYKKELAETEVHYEKKAANEALYLQNMKQAYDEYVAHCRLDLNSFQKKAKQNEDRLLVEKEEVVQESELQMRLLLEYCDYVGERHAEILKHLTDVHDNQKYRLQIELKKHFSTIDQMKNQTRTDEAMANRKLQLLKQEMTNKEMEALNTAQDLERAKDRITRLESSLQHAMAEIQRKTELADKWEFKAGEQQQQLNELERVRKALVSQMHALREEMGPKDLKIVAITEKLAEFDREYDMALRAVSDKENKLTQNANMMQLLQKQVRTLRSTLTTKESTLKRAAKLLDEFKYALQQARFRSEKVSIGDDNVTTSGEESADKRHEIRRSNSHMSFKGKKKVVEIIASTEEMESSLQRLNDILNSHLENEDITPDHDQGKILLEKERQIELMRGNINSLRTSIELGEAVATNKVQNLLHDNETLLRQMNSMRSEIKHLTETNNRLLAASEMKKTKTKPAIPKISTHLSSKYQPTDDYDFMSNSTDSVTNFADGLETYGIQRAGSEELQRSESPEQQMERAYTTSALPTTNSGFNSVNNSKTLGPSDGLNKSLFDKSESTKRTTTRAERLIAELIALNEKDLSVTRNQQALENSKREQRSQQTHMPVINLEIEKSKKKPIKKSALPHVPTR